MSAARSARPGVRTFVCRSGRRAAPLDEARCQTLFITTDEDPPR